MYDRQMGQGDGSDELGNGRAGDSIGSVRGIATRGAFYLVLSQFAKLALTLLSTIVIARLLSPDDYGVVAMTGAAVGLAGLFQDLGLGAATIQSTRISQDQASALFWLTMAATFSLSILLVVASPLVGWFYGDPRTTTVTAASGLSLLVGSAGAQHGALLNREMRFKTLSVIDTAAAVITFVVAVACAYWLRNYWALFLGTACGGAVYSALCWKTCSFRPNLRPSFRDGREFARYGGNVTAFNIVNYVVRNADTFLIGRYLGPNQVGLYDRSYKLMMMPLQNIGAPVHRLIFPLMSRLREEPERFRRTFNIAIRGVILATVPGIAVATTLSEEVMVWLLGPNWISTGPIFFWLGLSGLLQPATNLAGQLFLVSGRTAAMAFWGLIAAVVTVAGFVIGLQWGAVGVAAGFFFSLLLMAPFIFYASARQTSVKQRDLYSAQVEPLIGVGVACAIIHHYGLALELPTGLLMLISIPFAYVCAVATSYITPSGRAAIDEYFKLAERALQPLSAWIVAGRA